MSSPTGRIRKGIFFQPLSEAERLRLNNLEKENVQLKKELAQLKATKQGTKSTGASTRVAAVGNKGCYTCGQEGHRADRCPQKPATPATPKQACASAKSAGQSYKKVSFAKLHLTAVQEAAKTAVQETVTALAKNGWTPP